MISTTVSPPSPLKFCISCKHFGADVCTHPAALKEHDVIWGHPIYRNAREMRKPGAQCGFTAKLFECIIN